MINNYYVDLCEATYEIDLQVYRPETNCEGMWMVCRGGKLLKSFASFEDAQAWIRDAVRERCADEEIGYILKNIASVLECLEQIRG